MPLSQQDLYTAGAGAGLGLLLAYLIWKYANRDYKNDLISQGNAAISATTDPNLQKQIQDAALDYSKITRNEWIIAATVALSVGVLAAYYTKSVPVTIGAALIVGLLIIHYAQKSDERTLRALISTSGISPGDPGSQLAEYQARERQAARGVPYEINQNLSATDLSEAFDVKGPASTVEVVPPKKSIDSNINSLMVTRG